MHSYTLYRSKRKTMSLEVGKKGIIVRAPLRLAQSEIDRFVTAHAVWIEKHLEIAARRKEEEEKNALSDEQIKALKQRAADILPQKVAYYSRLMGLNPTGVKITSAEKRFGSCSPKNSLCFSYKLLLYPEEAVDYVVVHELAHIPHKNHGKAFYNRIASVLPDYKTRRALLKR